MCNYFSKCKEILKQHAHNHNVKFGLSRGCKLKNVIMQHKDTGHNIHKFKTIEEALLFKIILGF